jgi:hypothetical protein
MTLRSVALLALGLYVLFQAPLRADVPEAADREIQYLLEFVAASNCVFNRNGGSHEPANAADHLRLKYRRGSRYVNSAEQFIDRLASESSWTGRDYTVICDGEELSTNGWLHRALEAHRLETPESGITP